MGKSCIVSVPVMFVVIYFYLFIFVLWSLFGKGDQLDTFQMTEVIFP